MRYYTQHKRFCQGLYGAHIYKYMSNKLDKYGRLIYYYVMKRINHSIYANAPMLADYAGNRLFAVAYRIN